jgi:hypothetical protein
MVEQAFETFELSQSDHISGRLSGELRESFRPALDRDIELKLVRVGRVSKYRSALFNFSLKQVILLNSDLSALRLGRNDIFFAGSLVCVNICEDYVLYRCIRIRVVHK